MNVSDASNAIQSLFARLEQTAGPARAADLPASQRGAQGSGQVADARPQVNLPKDATSLNPNAPRGTYLNLVV